MKRRNFQKNLQIQNYQEKRYKNPYFEGQEAKHRRVGRTIVFVFALIILTTPIVLIAGPFFRVTGVFVSGLTTIPVVDVTSMAEGHLNGKWAGMLPHNHEWFVQSAVLQQQLQDRYQFETLSVTIENHTLIILAEERISQMVYRSGSVFSFLNLDGTILRELYPEERRQIHERIGIETTPITEEEQHNLPPLQPTIPVIQDMSGADTPLATELLAPITAHQIILIDKQLRVLGVDPVVYQIEKQHAAWFTVKTNNGYDVYFDGVEEPGKQINRLKTVLEEYQINPDEISYIDVRFTNRVYVK